MRTLTDGEREILDGIEPDYQDYYNPHEDPDVHVPGDLCHVQDAYEIIAGVVVCLTCYPAERAAWHAQHITPELATRSLTDLEDVTFS